jgi:DNA-binding beta-propeller fold protein YncE
MAVEFKCPSCSGDLRVKPGEKTTSCPYCGSSVLVPEDLREAAPVTVTVTGAGRPARKILACSVLAAVMLTGGAALLVFVMAGSTGKPGSVDGSRAGEVLLRFGSEGTGAGSFTDPRHVAVDGSGSIYVAEYGSGRVQVFGPDGTYLRQWFLRSGPEDVYVSGMDASADGRLYVCSRGRALVFDGETGEELGSLLPVTGQQDVYLPGDGGILLSVWTGGDEVYRLDEDGSVSLHLVSPVQGVSGDPELSPMIAGDGMGGIYVLGVFNSAVFVYDREGTYTLRFGSAGQEPGQFTAPSDIAVDPAGRIYVPDLHGLQVFDGTGRHLGTVDVPSEGFVYGMDVTPEGNLCLVTGAPEVLVIPPFRE